MAWVEQVAKDSFRVRYVRDDGTRGTIPGFPTYAAADGHAAGMETDKRRGVFIDPAAGKTKLDEWVIDWLDALDVATNTEDFYRSLIKVHILPQWGSSPLDAISGIKVEAWAKRLRTRYKPRTVEAITKLLRLLLADAVAERLISTNPIQPRRRGRRPHRRTEERIWATPEQVLAVADSVALLSGPWDAVLVVTAGWTGARWGELTGLQRHRLFLDDDEPWFGKLVIDAADGALHETSKGLTLGPPKTDESARTVELPPFLVRLLTAHLGTHRHRPVFPAPDGGWQRRSNYSRRAFRPATDGNVDQPRPKVVVPATRPGLDFHGLRHSHKTWLTADRIPDVVQAERLGHVYGNTIARTYTHIEDQLRRELLHALQDRWDKAVAERGTIPAWRASAAEPDIRQVAINSQGEVSESS